MQGRGARQGGGLSNASHGIALLPLPSPPLWLSPVPGAARALLPLPALIGEGPVYLELGQATPQCFGQGNQYSQIWWHKPQHVAPHCIPIHTFSPHGTGWYSHAHNGNMSSQRSCLLKQWFEKQFSLASTASIK